MLEETATIPRCDVNVRVGHGGNVLYTAAVEVHWWTLSKAVYIEHQYYYRYR